jgi:hypothetical protein
MRAKANAGRRKKDLSVICGFCMLAGLSVVVGSVIARDG